MRCSEGVGARGAGPAEMVLWILGKFLREGVNPCQDRKAYARCYKAIVDHEPTVPNYLTLGDALLAIQEPADAIKVCMLPYV